MTFVRNKREKDRVSTVQWYIAVYVRLSKEDGDKMESDSIQNQKESSSSIFNTCKTRGSRLPPWRFTPMTDTQAAALLR